MNSVLWECSSDGRATAFSAVGLRFEPQHSQFCDCHTFCYLFSIAELSGSLFLPILGAGRQFVFDPEIDPDLKLIIERWLRLSVELRQAIVKMVRWLILRAIRCAQEQEKTS